MSRTAKGVSVRLDSPLQTHAARVCPVSNLFMLCSIYVVDVSIHTGRKPECKLSPWWLRSWCLKRWWCHHTDRRYHFLDPTGNWSLCQLNLLRSQAEGRAKYSQMSQSRIKTEPSLIPQQFSNRFRYCKKRKHTFDTWTKWATNQPWNNLSVLTSMICTLTSLYKRTITIYK